MDGPINYRLSYDHPHRHFIQFNAEFPVDAEKLYLQLPAWRPGRYELGDFASQIREWQAYDKDGNRLHWQKNSKDRWEIDCEGLETVQIQYSFYADTINAGSTFLDEDLIYVNPVNCFLYPIEKQDSEFKVELEIPENYHLVSPLETYNKHEFRAKGVQELMDSPFFASAKIEHWNFELEGTPFHIWIWGNHKLSKQRLISEFEAFTRAQLKAFGFFPVKEYHYIFLFVPYKLYHGVEHEKCTVITLGPSTELNASLYNELLGVSSHELYHTWNVKALRPKEMYPYAFEKENYSRLGYVAEGVTTYFGDQFLHRSGVFSDEQYFKELSNLVQRHMDNPGRKNLSLADSSFDTWLDGYQKGIPWRKVSIYNEGALCALISDIKIIRDSRGKYSLDDALRLLFERFALRGIGFGEEDYRQSLEECSGTTFKEIFDKLIHGTEDYLPFLEEALSYIGLEIETDLPSSKIEGEWGCKKNEQQIITDLLPGSAADQAGLWYGDKLIAINDEVFTSTIDAHVAYLAGEEMTLLYERKARLRKTLIQPNVKSGYRKWTVCPTNEKTADQEKNYRFWKYRH